jgi:transcription elongation GreA/GreB family factor
LTRFDSGSIISGDVAPACANGLISENTPFAQALIGAIAGDEVPLHLPGGTRRLFRILGITKPQPMAAE